MWIKITISDQLKALQPGDNIIKYPIAGAPLDSFDEANPDNVSVRVVTQNDPASELLSISLTPSEIRYDAILGVSGFVFGPIRKHYKDVLDEGLWWVFDNSRQ